MRHVFARIRRALVGPTVAAVVLALVGATYQGVATAIERREFPHPGRLVDTGNRQLHIQCQGTGRPTVVLEAPAAGLSATWGWVEPELARITRVCSYDRAGLGWSEAGNTPFDPAAVAGELRTLLRRANEPGPFVVAGQGLGATFATLFAAQFGAEVAGLVLIDPPTVDGDSTGAPGPWVSGASPWLARVGFLRAFRLASDGADGLPAASAGPVAAFLNRPDHLTRAAAELRRWDDAVALARGSALDPALAVLRIDAAGHARTALLSDPTTARHAAEAIAGLVRRTREGQ